MHLPTCSLYRVCINLWVNSMVLGTDLFRYAGDLSGQPGESSQTCLVGLCTGLLAAAAIASSPAPLALIPLAIEVVLIAFRTGSYIGTTADRLEFSREGSASWSSIVAGTSEAEVQNVLDHLHKTKVFLLSIQLLNNLTDRTNRQ